MIITIIVMINLEMVYSVYHYVLCHIKLCSKCHDRRNRGNAEWADGGEKITRVPLPLPLRELFMPGGRRKKNQAIVYKVIPTQGTHESRPTL